MRPSVLTLGGPLALAAGLAGCAEGPAAGGEARPNVVVVLIDTLRADRLPFYGGATVEAPFLSALAEGGMVFDRVWSASSWTAPSTASLFTGLYPDQHGVRTGLVAYQRAQRKDVERRPLGRLPEALETLPERFKASGYRTFGVADNPNIGRLLGFTDGFDEFVTRPYDGAAAVTDVARQFGEELDLDDSPFLLYLHLMDPHAPYNQREPWYDPTAAAQERPFAAELAAYDSEIDYADDQLAQLFDDLALGDDVLWIFTSDHGEEFGDHGRLGHGFQLYEELLCVPLVVAGPGIEGGRRHAGPVSLVDVLPTLVDLCHLAPVTDELDGESLAGLLTGSASDAPTRPVFAERTRLDTAEELTMRAARSRSKKAIVGPDEGELQFFDLDRDPDERLNLATFRPDFDSPLVDRLEAFARRPRSVEPQSVPPLAADDPIHDVLEQLGYVR